MAANIFGVKYLQITFKLKTFSLLVHLKVKEILPPFEACQRVFWYTPPLFSITNK